MGNKKRLQGGWKQLHVSLKIVLVITTLNILLSIISLGDQKYFIFGIFVYGLVTIILQLLLNVIGAAILVFAIWKRYPWAWKYGAAYFGFFIINGILGLSAFYRILPVELRKFMLSGFLVGIASIILNLIFLLIVIKKRHFFQEAKK